MRAHRLRELTYKGTRGPRRYLPPVVVLAPTRVREVKIPDARDLWHRRAFFGQPVPLP